MNSMALGRKFLNRTSSLLINIFDGLSHSKQNAMTDFARRLHYFACYYSGKRGKTLAYCRTPLGHLFIPYEDGSFYCLKEVFIDEIYERPWRGRTFDLIIDAGAHVGIFVLKVARSGGMVLAFEPHPINYLLLVENIKLNALNNVIPFKLALFDRAGVVSLFEGRFSGSASLKALPGRRRTSIKVKVDSLDNVMTSLNLDPTALRILLKVDVEGSEVEVLQGARKVLTMAKEAMVSVASYHYEGEGTHVCSLLEEMGFEVIFSDNIVYAKKKHY